MQSEIGALKDTHENVNRNAANDLVRHNQMVVHRKIKRLENKMANQEKLEAAVYQLLEALGENICNCILKNYKTIKEIRLTIRKPEAPVSGIFDYMGISITRNREDIW